MQVISPIWRKLCLSRARHTVAVLYKKRDLLKPLKNYALRQKTKNLKYTWPFLGKRLSLPPDQILPQIYLPLVGLRAILAVVAMTSMRLLMILQQVGFLSPLYAARMQLTRTMRKHWHKALLRPVAHMYGWLENMSRTQLMEIFLWAVTPFRFYS